METWRLAVLTLGPLVAGLMAWATLSQLDVGDLSFQDQAWWLSGDRPVCDACVHVVLDFQHAMLLRIAGRGERGRWLWVERSGDSPYWLDLRRAVHAALPTDGSTIRPGAESRDHRSPVSAA